MESECLLPESLTEHEPLAVPARRRTGEILVHTETLVLLT